MSDNKQLNDINDASIGVIDHFIGQRGVVDQVKVALEASWNDSIRLPHMLMIGPPGVGKSELAHVLGKEMGSESFEQLAQNISTIEQMRGLLMEPKDKDILFLDEIHELNPSAQTTLYRAMENGEVFLDGSKAKSRKMKIASYTIIGATTDEYKLLKPLRDRFKLVLPFKFYGDEELATLLKQRANQLGWEVEDVSIFHQIATRSKGTPRIGLKLLEAAKRYARSQGTKTITVEHFTAACALEGLDTLGLGPNERAYLHILAEAKEPVRLNVLASRMGLPKKTLTDTIEGFLLRIGLIGKSDKGVMITPDGIEHLRSNP